MQSEVNATDARIVREQQLFNGRPFHVFIYNKVESISGLHQHDY
jgi:AraC family cel operon transcriptional repressor